MKKISLFMAALACVLGWGCFSFLSHASETQEPALRTQTEEEWKEQEDAVQQDGYITISVDAEDDSGELTYAIDSDAPEAFGQSNVFMIDPTQPHTIYVKDRAGNITSQSFQPIGVEFREDSGYSGLIASDTGDGDNSSSSEPERVLTGEGVREAAEDGSGTMYDKVTTDGTDAFSRVFYTLTTREGEVFYLVIDQNRGQDNVYLLNTVTVDELQALAVENGYALSERNESASDNPPNLSGGETIDDVMGNAPAPTSQKKGGITANAKSTIMILVVAVIGGGAYYYLKVAKKKKDAAMDEIDNALDMDDFTSEADDREEIEMPADQAISDDEFYDMYEEESDYLDRDPDDDEEEEME